MNDQLVLQTCSIIYVGKVIDRVNVVDALTAKEVPLVL